ncbi:MAG: porin family protein [Porphyromonadaceae bacterium]|nr:porin family protein [Porphyromonadaceae bacterium]
MAPQFNIGGGHDLKTLDVTVDAHYVFDCDNSDFSFYPIMGVGVAHYWNGNSYKDNRLFLDLGIGGEYAINDSFSIFAEVKSQWQTDYSKGNLVVGVSYKF